MTSPDAPWAPVKKTCSTCPNLMSADESARVLGRSMNGDVCLIKGFLLGTANLEPKAREVLHEAKAKGCTNFGKLGPTVPRNTFPVAMPDVTRMTPTKDRLASCKGCQHFVTEREVIKEWGWNGGFCAAKGEVIVSSKLAHVARNCDMGALGVPDASLRDAILFEEYATALEGEMTTLKAMLKGLDIPDPLDYESDAPVSDEDKSKGIIAWRSIYHPDDSQLHVELPVFSPDSFTEDERATIPRVGDAEHPELYLDHDGLVYTMAALWRGLGETPALWGMPGVGKTELARHVAWLMQVPFTRLSINAGTEIDEIAGKMMYEPERGTYFQPGRLPRAYVRPGVVCLDEPNTGPVDVWQFIRPLTDNSKQLVLDMAGGERLAQHEFCYLTLAMNPAWDVKNVGATQIGAADASRLMHVTVDLPSDEIERAIIDSRVRADGWKLTRSQLDLVMEIAKEIRLLCDADTLPMTWGIRENIKVARALRFYPPKTAYRIAAGDYLEPEERQALANAVNSHIV